MPTNPSTTVTLLPPLPPFSRVMSTLPRSFPGGFASAPRAGTVAGPRGSPEPTSAPKGFWPRPWPPSVDTRPATSGPPAAGSRRDGGLAPQEQERLRIASALEEMHKLGMERAAGLLQVSVQHGHLARDSAAIGALDAVHEGDERFLNPVFHGGLRTQSNTVAADVKPDCNVPAVLPACLSLAGSHADCAQTLPRRPVYFARA